MALATSPTAVVLVSVFYVIDFIVEANVLVPSKIEGQVINFKAALVLFIVLVGLAIGGIVAAPFGVAGGSDRPRPVRLPVQGR